MTDTGTERTAGPGEDAFQFTLRIPEELSNRTVRSILQSRLKLSRRMLRHLITTDGVLRNGEPVYQTARVEIGDIINVMLPNEQTELVLTPMALDIEYEDGQLVVVNKPNGQLTHPTARERADSLLSGVYAAIQPAVPHCIHRLDRDTSGLVMLAKHGHFHHLFDASLRSGKIHRAYCAIVNLADENPDLGWQTIDLPIAQDPRSPSRRIISATGQRAVTHYRIVAKCGAAALVFVVLETGRTHQIRVHFAATGQPLIGDVAYGRRRMERGEPNARELGRQALHGIYLWFQHPLTMANQEVYASPPADLVETWNALGGQPTDWPNRERCAELFMNCPIFANIGLCD